MSKKKKYGTKCKNTAHRDQRMQELKDILTSRVPARIREIINEGKANDDAWMIDRIDWARSVESSVLFAQGKSEEWLERMIEIFAICSFVPGGSTAALGVKLLGLHFDAELIVGRKVRH